MCSFIYNFGNSTEQILPYNLFVLPIFRFHLKCSLYGLVHLADFRFHFNMPFSLACVLEKSSGTGALGEKLWFWSFRRKTLVPPGQGVKWDRTLSGWEVVGAVAAVVVDMEEVVVGEPGDPIEGVVVEEELPEGQPGEQGGGQVGHLVVAHVEGDQGGGVGQHVVRDKPDVIAAEVEAGDGGPGQQGL